MKALIYKDLVSIKKYALIFAILILATSVYGLVYDHMVVSIGFLILIPIALINVFFDVDIKSNSHKYIMAMRIDKRKIVLSRYVIIWIISGLAVVVTLISNIKLANNNSLPNTLLLPFIFMVTSFLPLIQLPFMYKFGNQNARMLFTLIYFAVFLFLNHLWKNNVDIINSIKSILDIDKNYLGLVILIFIIILNILSLMVSFKIYENKEF